MHPPTMAAAVIPRPPWCLNPGDAAYDNQPKIMDDCCMWQRREWGTMVAVIGNLLHDVSTDVVSLLWVVSYVGIRRVVYQPISDVSPTR